MRTPVMPASDVVEQWDSTFDAQHRPVEAVPLQRSRVRYIHSFVVGRPRKG